MMYLRPGNLGKDFLVKRKKESISEDGTPYFEYVDMGVLIRGALADADTNMNDRKKHLWDQEQHSLTHTIVCRGKPVAKKGDLLICGDRYFLILLADDTGDLGVATIYYAEERNDLR